VQRECIIDADIRLVGSQSPREGRLEVKVGGHWGTVCDDDFGNMDAGVACYMLGFGYVPIKHVRLLAFFIQKRLN